MSANERDILQGKSGHASAHKRVVELYRRAFADYRAQALWNVKELDDPTPAQALAITRQLRTEGDMNARHLAERIEAAARADN